MAKYTWQDYRTNEPRTNIFGKWTETDCHTWFWNINHVGNKAKDDPSEDFSIGNGNGTGHEA